MALSPGDVLDIGNDSFYPFGGGVKAVAIRILIAIQYVGERRSGCIEPPTRPPRSYFLPHSGHKCDLDEVDQPYGRYSSR